MLGLLVPCVLALLIFDSWSDYETLHNTTDEAYDRALLGPALALSNSARPGVNADVVLEIPQLALSMLESAPGQRVYFRVTLLDKSPDALPALDGWQHAVNLGVPVSQLSEIAGMRDLPFPPEWPSGVEPVFYNAVYRKDPVRVVALIRPFDETGIWNRQLLVLVAESTSARSALQSDAWRNKLSRNLVIIVVVVAMLLLGVYWAMRPLSRLRNDVQARAPDDLNPLDANRVPQEIAPLVQAVNHHVQRLRDVLDAQSQFMADASHQLRTPLAIMRTQAEYALREPGTPRTRASLQAILAQLERSARLTSQLLSLAHARHAPREATPQRMDIRELAYEMTLQHLPLAHAKRQDLGWDEESTKQPLWVIARESTITEALSNLIHNAIHYTPANGRITVSALPVRGMAVLGVRDTGPGIAPALRSRAFERFRRGDRQAGEGAGLGLAIAREFVTLNLGRIELSDGDENDDGGHGLCVRILLPLAPALENAAA